MRSFGFLLFPLVACLVVLADMLFVVDEGCQVIVSEFGRLKYVHNNAGFYWKMPYYQKITRYEKRMLDFEVPSTELTLKDRKRLVADIFMRYRITDPAAFYKTVRTERNARNRLSPLVAGSMRNVLGTHNIEDILSERRHDIMKEIGEMSQQVTGALGIEIVEVRLSKTDLPMENSQAIYKRMISSLKREAQKWRGKGKEVYLKRCAEADRDSQEIIANAEKEAKETIGEADLKRLKIYNEAYGLSPSFAKWFLEFEALQAGLGSKSAAMIMLPESMLGEFGKRLS